MKQWLSQFNVCILKQILTMYYKTDFDYLLESLSNAVACSILTLDCNSATCFFNASKNSRWKLLCVNDVKSNGYFCLSLWSQNGLTTLKISSSGQVDCNLCNIALNFWLPNAYKADEVVHCVGVSVFKFLRSDKSTSDTGWHVIFFLSGPISQYISHSSFLFIAYIILYEK